MVFPMMKKYISLLIVLLSFAAVLSPIFAGAQEIISGSSIEVVRGGVGGDQKDVEGGVLLGFGLLILIGIGVPTVVSLCLRHVLKSNLKTYAATYVFVLICYAVAKLTVEGTPSGSIPMTALMLLMPAMLGSLLAQTIYLLRIPKKKTKKIE